MNPIQKSPDQIPAVLADELHALYRDEATAEPPPMLDRRILDAARAAVESDRTRPPRTAMPWWKHWVTVASVVAVTTFGVSVAWRVFDQDRRTLEEALNPGESRDLVDRALPRSDAELPAAPAALALPVAKIRDKAAVSRGQSADRAPESQNRSLPAKGEAASSRTVHPRQFEETQAAIAPALMAPAGPAPSAAPSPEAATSNKARRAEAERGRESPEANEARDMAVGAASEVSAKSARPMADDAATPEEWVRHVRELRAAGRTAEAARSLARLRARYPDFMLPEDIPPAR